MPRFYYEQDGDATKNSAANEHYVIDCYADPLSDQMRTDIPRDHALSPMAGGAKMARQGRRLAALMNETPPWEPWDTLAAKQDKYVCPPLRPLEEMLQEVLSQR